MKDPRIKTTIEVSGIDKQAVGQFAAEIRRWRQSLNPTRARVSPIAASTSSARKGKKK